MEEKISLVQLENRIRMELIFSLNNKIQSTAEFMLRIDPRKKKMRKKMCLTLRVCREKECQNNIVWGLCGI